MTNFAVSGMIEDLATERSPARSDRTLCAYALDPAGPEWWRAHCHGSQCGL